MVDLTGAQHGYHEGLVTEMASYSAQRSGNTYLQPPTTDHWAWITPSENADTRRRTFLNYHNCYERRAMNAVEHVLDQYRYNGMRLAEVIDGTDAVWNEAAERFLVHSETAVHALWDAAHDDQKGSLWRDQGTSFAVMGRLLWQQEGSQKTHLIAR